MNRLAAAVAAIIALAAVAIATPAAAWSVGTACELIKYTGDEYKVYTTDWQLVQDWTTQDTVVDPGTYKVKFTNGEKMTVVIEECPPPRQERVAVNGRGKECGDPRLWTRGRNKGTIPATIQLTFTPGNKDKFPDGFIRTVQKTVPVGGVKTIGPRWVRGLVTFSVYDPSDDQFHTLFSFQQGKDLKPHRWGKNGCPANRFGTPTFKNPDISGSYANTFNVARR